MATNQDIIAGVVQKVIEELMGPKSTLPEGFKGIYDRVEDAVENAAEAQRQLIALPLKTRDKMIAEMRKAVLDNNEMLSDLAIRETKLGRYEDKIRENILCATKTPGTEDIPVSYTHLTLPTN